MAKWTPSHGRSLVCVLWNDADGSAPDASFYEEEIDTKHRATSMQTYGLLVKQDKDGVTLMTEFYKEDDGKNVFRGRTFIPDSLITKVEVMATPWMKKPRTKRKSVETSPPPTPQQR